MSSIEPHDRDRSSFASIIGFALGSLAAVGLAVLRAAAHRVMPRRMSGALSRGVRRGTRETLGQVRRTADRMRSNARSALQAGFESFLH